MVTFADVKALDNCRLWPLGSFLQLLLARALLTAAYNGGRRFGPSILYGQRWRPWYVWRCVRRRAPRSSLCLSGFLPVMLGQQAVQRFVRRQLELFLLLAALLCNRHGSGRGRRWRRGLVATARWDVRNGVSVLRHVLPYLSNTHPVRLHMSYRTAKIAAQLIHDVLLLICQIIGGFLCSSQKLQ